MLQKGFCPGLFAVTLFESYQNRKKVIAEMFSLEIILSTLLIELPLKQFLLQALTGSHIHSFCESQRKRADLFATRQTRLNERHLSMMKSRPICQESALDDESLSTCLLLKDIFLSSIIPSTKQLK